MDTLKKLNVSEECLDHLYELIAEKLSSLCEQMESTGKKDVTDLPSLKDDTKSAMKANPKQKRTIFQAYKDILKDPEEKEIRAENKVDKIENPDEFMNAHINLNNQKAETYNKMRATAEKNKSLYDPNSPEGRKRKIEEIKFNRR